MSDTEIAAPLGGKTEVARRVEHILLGDHETDLLRERAEVSEEVLLVEPVDHDTHSVNSDRERVFTTSPGAHQPRRACKTAFCIFENSLVR